MHGLYASDLVAHITALYPHCSLLDCAEVERRWRGGDLSVHVIDPALSEALRAKLRPYKTVSEANQKNSREPPKRGERPFYIIFYNLLIIFYAPESPCAATPPSE